MHRICVEFELASTWSSTQNTSRNWLSGSLNSGTAILGEKTPETRIKKLNAHMNRDQLPIAWVAHANGQLLGTAALRVHDLEGREDLTPWLGGVFVGSQFRRRGIGAALCTTVEEAARSLRVRLFIFSHSTSRAWYSGQGWREHLPLVLARASRRHHVEKAAERLTSE